jgi:membrane-associated protein
MNALIQVILPYILLYKYGAIFLITLVAALAFPVPPGALLMASAAFAAQGYLSFWKVVVIGTLGNIAGDNIGYFLARQYGKQILRRIGFRKVLDSQKYKNVEARMKKRPGFLIFISRFEVFSNLAVNIISGLSEVPYRKYVLFETIGEFLQVFAYCAIGYLVGDNWQAVSGIVSRFLLLILLLVALVIAIFWKKAGRWFGLVTDTEYTKAQE